MDSEEGNEEDDDDIPDVSREEEAGQLMEYRESMDVEAAENQIVLHEDKQYYPDASEVYGEGKFDEISSTMIVSDSNFCVS